MTSSSGNTFSNGNHSISYTIGECVIQTHQETEIILTQGFHQPDITVTEINKSVSIDLTISAFPIPTSSHVVLKINKPQGLQYIMFDLNGKVLKHENIENEFTKIDFSALNTSTYVITVMDNNQKFKLFKVIKE